MLKTCRFLFKMGLFGGQNAHLVVKKKNIFQSLRRFLVLKMFYFILLASPTGRDTATACANYCGPGTRSHFCGGRKPECPEKTLEVRSEIDSNSIHIQHCSRGGRRDWCPCLLYTSPSPRDLSTSRMPSSAWKKKFFKITVSRFVNVSEEEINLMKENAIPRNTKHATKFGMTHFKGKMSKLC